MEAYLIGAVIGAIVGASAIVGIFDVRSREKAAEEQRSNEIWTTLVFLATAENGRLRVSVDATGLTEDSKKAAAMTVAALDAVLARKRDELREIRASRVTCEHP